MMTETRMKPQAMSRITCITHHMLKRPPAEPLAALGVREVLVENARCVRQNIRARALGLGHAVKLNDAPMDIFQMSVPRETSGQIADILISAAELRTPGHGMLYIQDIVEYGRTDTPTVTNSAAGSPSGILRDMSLLTCILSRDGGGETLARIALSFGVGVPVVSMGTGTGIRDRLGLLRITIPPEKEIVRLMIPAHDADGIRRLLIKEGHMDRAGGGFLYQTPIREGIADPLLRLGRQQHAASMEQVIAALDDLKGGTEWRKRLAGFKEQPEYIDRRIRQRYREISFTCAEGNMEFMVRAATGAGAGGATTSGAHCLYADRSPDNSSPCETGILCVPDKSADSVLNALWDTATQRGDEACRIQILEAPAVFTY